MEPSSLRQLAYQFALARRKESFREWLALDIASDLFDVHANFSATGHGNDRLISGMRHVKTNIGGDIGKTWLLSRRILESQFARVRLQICAENHSGSGARYGKALSISLEVETCRPLALVVRKHPSYFFWTKSRYQGAKFPDVDLSFARRRHGRNIQHTAIQFGDRHPHLTGILFHPFTILRIPNYSEFDLCHWQGRGE
ncbi:MAG TPA: hypothetical protein VMP68_20590 [Candidatus Eisenbacteria bacterium]|nr:hypothetical protein [Candidatus Eisenbacteria bacterium]